MDLSVITVSYNSKDYIDSCILSVFTSSLHCSYEHFVVDNHSTDGTVERIEEGYSKYVTLIKNPKNLGFAAANNQAFQFAKGRYLLFLNPDMQICQGTLDTLIHWMDSHPDAGIASCKLVTPTCTHSPSSDSRIPAAQFSTPHPLLRPIRFLTPLPFLPYFLHIQTFGEALQHHFFDPQFNDEIEQEVDQPRGAFLLVRRELLDRLGYAFDPRYFIWFEDIDLCREAKKLGYKIFYLPKMHCIDYRGRSFLTQSEAWRYLRLSRSFLVYTKKWHSPLHLLWLYLAIPIGFLLRIPQWGFKSSLKALLKRA